MNLEIVALNLSKAFNGFSILNLAFKVKGPRVKAQLTLIRNRETGEKKSSQLEHILLQQNQQKLQIYDTALYVFFSYEKLLSFQCLLLSLLTLWKFFFFFFSRYEFWFIALHKCHEIFTLTFEYFIEIVWLYFGGFWLFCGFGGKVFELFERFFCVLNLIRIFLDLWNRSGKVLRNQFTL